MTEAATFPLPLHGQREPNPLPGGDSGGSPNEPDMLMKEDLSEDADADADEAFPLPLDDETAVHAMQPSMSRLAAHLASPNTPATEKASFIDLDDAQDAQDLPDPSPYRLLKIQPSTPSAPPIAQVDSTPEIEAEVDSVRVELGLASNGSTAFIPPRFAGQKSHTELSRPQALKQALGGVTRHRRAGSTGSDAIRRFREAMPSLTLPSLPSLASFGIFNQSEKKGGRPDLDSPGSVSPRPVSSSNSRQAPPLSSKTSGHAVVATRVVGEPLGARGTHSQELRRSTSADSLLYQSLSRMSSFGDDNRFSHVTEMANVRFKAIRESLPDMPQFRTPAMLRVDSLKVSVGKKASNLSGSAPTALDRVLESLTGDIVILGGYRGSILRDAKPPHQQLWAPVKIGLNMRNPDLEVGLDPEDELTMPERIIPSGMLKHIGPVDISRKLFKRLRSSANCRRGTLRVWDYGYDWRLSPHLLSKQLIDFLSSLPSNKPGAEPKGRGAIVICHSLGGLIVRHAVNCRPELFAGVVYAGTPQRCINILGPLRSGESVLFNERILTARVHFTLRTTFLLLPDDGACFVDKNTGEAYPVDFFNIEDWIRYRWSPCVGGPALPSLRSRSPNQTSGPLNYLLESLPAAIRPRKDGDGESGNTDSDENDKPRTISPAATSPVTSTDGPTPPSAATPTLPSSDLASPKTSAENIAYLARTLDQVRHFRAALAHDPTISAKNAYPPFAVLYGRDTPTVYAAQVESREAIATVDAYDDLLFRSGDGVVLARQAMLPAGYDVVHGGHVSSSRGHLTLLGDLDAVGRALEAVVRGRSRGIGLGKDGKAGKKGVDGIQ